MKVPLVVYFDTNIVRDLAEGRLPQAEDKMKHIKTLIAKGKVVIAPSFEVLDEILSAPDISDSTRTKNAQFYEALVNWRYALKPSNRMLKDDIISCALKGGPSAPYRAIDEDRSGFIKSIKEGRPILPPKVWEKTVKRSQHRNKTFVEEVFNNYVKKLPQNAKTELRSHPQKTWQEWWFHGGIAEIIANSLAGDPHVKARCSLLSLPTIRAGVGFMLHIWYQQIVSEAKLKPTEHYDFRNAILTGGVGRIVTQDKKLRNAINHIPDLNAKTWTLEEFISEIT